MGHDPACDTPCSLRHPGTLEIGEPSRIRHEIRCRRESGDEREQERDAHPSLTDRDIDYLDVYTGETLAATTKGRTKRHWVGDGPDTGVQPALYDLILDPREAFPMLIPALHMYSQFDRIRARHELWAEKYPHRKKARGVPLTGLTNARPETVAIVERLEALRSELPFDPFEFMEWDPPADYAPINAVD